MFGHDAQKRSDPADGDVDPGDDLSRNVFGCTDALAGAGTSVGLAVSGGSDSMALMVLVARWAKDRARTARVATVDHGVSPESRQVAEQVVEAATRLDLSCDILTRASNGHHPSQARLRGDRYGLICAWARERDLDTIAVGHTADDLIETLWMRLCAGSHWYGLASPLPVAPVPVWPQGMGIRIVRPLLTVRRSALRVVASGLGWYDDPANSDCAYERVRIRQRTGHMSQEDHLSWSRLWWRLARARQSIMAEVRALCQRQTGWREDGSVLCERRVLATAFPVVASVFLGIAIQSVSGRAHAVPVVRCEALRRRILGRDVSFAATLAGAWIRVDSTNVEIAAAPEKHARTSGARIMEPIRIEPHSEHIWDGRFAVKYEGSVSTEVVSSDACGSGGGVHGELADGGAISAMARRSFPACYGRGRLTVRALHALRARHLLTDPKVSALEAVV